MVKLLECYLDNPRPLLIVTILLSLCVGAGLLVGPLVSPGDAGTSYLGVIMPNWAWAVSFFSIAIVRILNVSKAFSNAALNFIAPVIAIWLWSIVLVSAVMINPPRSLDILLVVPIFIEFWILSRNIESVKTRGNSVQL